MLLDSVGKIHTKESLTVASNPAYRYARELELCTQ